MYDSPCPPLLHLKQFFLYMRLPYVGQADIGQLSQDTWTTEPQTQE